MYGIGEDELDDLLNWCLLGFFVSCINVELVEEVCRGSH